jgi:hypothetical protein
MEDGAGSSQAHIKYFAFTSIACSTLSFIGFWVGFFASVACISMNGEYEVITSVFFSGVTIAMLLFWWYMFRSLCMKLPESE